MRPKWKRGGDAARSGRCTAWQALAVRPGPFRTGAGTHGGGAACCPRPDGEGRRQPARGRGSQPAKKIEKISPGAIDKEYIQVYICIYRGGITRPENIKDGLNMTIIKKTRCLQCGRSFTWTGPRGWALFELCNDCIKKFSGV